MSINVPLVRMDVRVRVYNVHVLSIFSQMTWEMSFIDMIYQ